MSIRLAPDDSQATKREMLIVGIAGGTGSGKSKVARKIAEGLPQDSVVIIEHDSYYRDHSTMTAAEREAFNYDHPEALETELLVEHLRDLRHGKTVHIPVYDFVNHKRSSLTRLVAPVPIVIVEGILVFSDERIREQLDVRVFVDTDADLRIFRRIRRDIEKRGRTFDQVRTQYYQTIRPMHLQFVEPSKHHADVIVPEGGHRPVAVDLILAKCDTFLRPR